MEQNKDYRLLRPFDLEAAKRGEGVLWNKHPVRWVDLAEAPRNQLSIVEHGCGLSYATKDELRMAPLCWVEGRPVYKGDVLYRPGIDDGPVVASNIENVDGDDYLVFEGSDRDEFADNRRGYMTWTEPNPILCEVEGKPVRKGDRLWSNYFGYS